MTQTDSPRDHLPLQAHVFHILLSLIQRERHGYSIIQDIARRTDGEMMLGTSTLYAAIKRMVSAGLLMEVPKPADADSDDARRRYYRATELGNAVAREEARRIRQLGQLVAQIPLLDGSRDPERAREGA
ncbi:MAG: PadR family transcriptional regulator [Gemmatimonadota bacterium]|nr:MAG: PadR family transcriptional regulator [Gemmatimonadota bacterium]